MSQPKTNKRASNKPNTKVLQTRKRHRRQWLTFLRMCRYGVNNFTRNSWLTVAATAVMTITLLIIFVTASAQNILTNTVSSISNKIDMSIYLETGTTKEEAGPAIDDLKALSNVREVEFISSEEARATAAENNKQNIEVLDAISEATNRLPATLRIQLKDVNDTSQLDTFVSENQEVKQYLHEEREPSFAGERREAIQKIADWTILAQRVGLAASAVFVVVSSLTIFNTIRMAIFSRQEEIQMMKLIGADKNFIRGPFIVEAVVYGFIAALLATGFGFLILNGLKDLLGGAGVDVSSTINLMTTYIGFVLLGMIILGAIIGVGSSLLATRRYLRI